jgi:hypothetical protein
MKKGLLGILAVGIMATAANAATLSMQFAGGGNEVTLGASQSATVEIVITMGINDGAKSPSKLTGFDMRFDVGGIAINPDAVGDQGSDGRYVVDGSTKYDVTGITGFAGWSTAASDAVPHVFNGSYFLSAGDPNGLIGVVGTGAVFSTVVATFDIHKEVFEAGDTFIVIRQGAALPALYNGPAAWANRFPYTTEIPTVRNSFVTGLGNPSDNGPQWDPYHGYSTLQPLIIHNVPEPGALALLVLGGFAALRRRK